MPKPEDLTPVPRKVMPIIILAEVGEDPKENDKIIRIVDAVLTKTRILAEKTSDFDLKCCLIPCGIGCGFSSEKFRDMTEVSAEQLFGDQKRTVYDAMHILHEVLKRNFWQQDEQMQEMGIHMPGIYMISHFDDAESGMFEVKDIQDNELFLHSKKVVVCTNPARTEEELRQFVPLTHPGVTLIALYDESLSGDNLVYRKREEEEMVEYAVSIMLETFFKMVETGHFPCLPPHENSIPVVLPENGDLTGADPFPWFVDIGLIGLDPVDDDDMNPIRNPVLMGEIISTEDDWP